MTLHIMKGPFIWQNPTKLFHFYALVFVRCIHTGQKKLFFIVNAKHIKKVQNIKETQSLKTNKHKRPVTIVLFSCVLTTIAYIYVEFIKTPIALKCERVCLFYKR